MIHVFSTCKQDDTSCKGKSNLLLAKYRHTGEHHAQMRINEDDYWSERPKRVPKSSSRDIYIQIHKWFGQKIKIQPHPYVRNLLQPQDEN